MMRFVKRMEPIHWFLLVTFLVGYAIVEWFAVYTDAPNNLTLVVFAILWWLGYFTFRHRWPPPRERIEPDPESLPPQDDSGRTT